MVIKDLKTIHKKVLMFHHGLVGANVLIEYNDGTKGVVKATISDEKGNEFHNDVYIEKYIINFHIIKQNLIEKELPIKGFKTITYNREKYGVTDITDSSSIGNTIVLRCTKNG